MINTVGSQEVIPTILRARKNLMLVPSRREFDILVGSIIGDGYITKKGKVQIEHSEHQRDYVQWKYRNLTTVVGANSILCTQRENKRYPGRKTVSYRFWTRQYFRAWRNIFYPYGKKIIPKNIKDLFSPLVVAVLYMDDGTLRKGKGLSIATDSFSKNDVQIIQQALFDRYNIKANIVSRNRLNIGVKDSKCFFQIIHPFIIHSMQYKLP